MKHRKTSGYRCQGGGQEGGVDMSAGCEELRPPVKGGCLRRVQDEIFFCNEEVASPRDWIIWPSSCQH